MSIGIANISNRNRLRLKGFKLLPENKPEPQLIPAVEFITPPEEAMSFIDKLNDLFDIELIGAEDKVFTEDERAFIDERAGMYEYYGKLSRAEAEDRAIKELKNNFKLYEQH